MKAHRLMAVRLKSELYEQFAKKAMLDGTTPSTRLRRLVLYDLGVLIEAPLYSGLERRKQ